MFVNDLKCTIEKVPVECKKSHFGTLGYGICMSTKWQDNDTVEFNHVQFSLHNLHYFIIDIS